VLERIARTLPAIAWMSFIFAMSSQHQFPKTFGVSIEFMSIVAHMLLYGTLALLLLYAFWDGRQISRSMMLAAVVGAVLYGVTDEFHQSFVPGRNASVFDLVVNACGATIAVIAWPRVWAAFTSAASR
jgi:VanZ family protein